MSFFHLANSQCPSVDFITPGQGCLNEQILFSANTSFATYEWDFCPGDLVNSPSAGLLLSSSQSYGGKMEIVEQNGQYFGFSLTRESGKLFRFDFGSDIRNTPTPVNLGGLGVNSVTWRTIEIVKEGANYVGFIIDVTKLYRITFGTSLTSLPTNAETLFSNSPFDTAYDIAEVQQNGVKFLFAVSQDNIIRLKFSQSYADVPTSITMDLINVTGASVLSGISFALECDKWFAVTSAIGNSKIHKIAFNAGLDDPAPVVSEITGLGFATVAPSNLALVMDDGNYHAFIQSNDPTSLLYRIDFGNTMANNTPTGVVLGNLGISSLLWGFSLYKIGSQWTGFSVENSGSKFFKINFPNSCFATLEFSKDANPVVKTTHSGNFKISLTVTDIAGSVASKSHSIQINSNLAPDIDFASQNVCAQSNIDFTTQNLSGDILTYNWDFGDGQASASANPSHIYSIGNDYPVILRVTSTNCANIASKTTTVYNLPVADFTLPTASPVCTNQHYLFSNSSTFDVPSNPTWEWRLNGVLVSSQKDLTALFNSVGTQDIRLKALIPGCENEMIKTISAVIAGPVVDFSAQDDCQGNAVSFSNTTVGADAGYAWDFGDGTTSTVTSPSHIFSSPAILQVTLTGKNSLGCQNVTTKPITIYSNPQPSFSVDLPPFSCNNSSTPFQNTTAPLTDSNIISWRWQFGDGGNSLLKAPSHTYSTAASYSASLTATSDMGCSATSTQTINISPSPSSDFTVGPSCINQSTKFTDTSTGSVQSRLWQIASGSFSVPNPSYTFLASGDFSATLTTTGANGCANVKTKTVTVPVPALVGFSVSNPCAGKIAAFADATTSTTDATVGWNWNIAGSTYTGSTANYSFSPDGTYNVKLTTTQASGCKYTFSNNILINPTPVATFTASPDRGAAPLTVQFNNTSQQANSYKWKFNDKVTATSTSISPVYTFTSLGDYSTELTATNSFGCSDVVTRPIKVLVPSIDLIMQNFSLSTDPVTGKLKCVVTIFNNSNIPINAAEVTLFLAEKAVVNETVSLQIAPGQSVTKPLTVTLSSDQFDFTFLCAEVLSEKDIQQDNNRRCINLEVADYVFDPYPNPTSGTLKVDWISEKSGTARILVYDGMGKKAYDWETPSQSGLNQAVLDLTFLTAGLYYVSVETSNAKKTIRFLRQ